MTSLHLPLPGPACQARCVHRGQAAYEVCTAAGARWSRGHRSSPERLNYSLNVPTLFIFLLLRVLCGGWEPRRAGRRPALGVAGASEGGSRDPAGPGRLETPSLPQGQGRCALLGLVSHGVGQGLRVQSSCNANNL